MKNFKFRYALILEGVSSCPPKTPIFRGGATFFDTLKTSSWKYFLKEICLFFIKKVKMDGREAFIGHPVWNLLQYYFVVIQTNKEVRSNSIGCHFELFCKQTTNLIFSTPENTLKYWVLLKLVIGHFLMFTKLTQVSLWRLFLNVTKGFKRVLIWEYYHIPFDFI